MEFKGTKGEWGIMMDDDEIKIIQSSSLENGAGWRSYVAVCNEVQCSEDAHLIAAAPDLLEALQFAEKAMTEGRSVTYPEWYGVINKARSAISKALGEE
ncbi:MULTISPECIES: hypothetical protein [Salmonella]|uniref:hypothetical protein n=1 Tax=Salmonella TaxID=590 RepID=UPI000709AD58|nr:hypothetical protein [Salmonella enterica]EAA7383401.1 hypothetical protein [Salmonella enterica subsp. enterica]EBF8287311.1 hypothetical protein [Salmonella enterica subsp. houtenae]EBS3741721.1 hypothetical protein [Salmonella enterica subsp. enterica serovar Saintpaul]EBW3496305.1 hypothetical protein [Salmonella enterica subsp. enterica serovar Newport]EBX9903942.1 hypothetical protein [Salmonella enterica subsp. enterica serovar Amager]ECD7693641.1 hypothetical protein [Salmonella en